MPTAYELVTESIIKQLESGVARPMANSGVRATRKPCGLRRNIEA